MSEIEIASAASAEPVSVSADIFIAVDERAAANAVLNSALGQDAGSENFARALSPAGVAPATAHGSFGAYSAGQWAQLREALALAAPQLGSLRYYVRGFPLPSSPAGNRLLETNSPTATGSIGEAWSPAASFADAGVTPVVVSLL